MSASPSRSTWRSQLAALLHAAIFIGFVLAAGAATGASDEARTVELAGTLTNTTAEAEAPARLVLVIRGESVSAMLKTEPPLVGSGKIEGRIRDGWCELAGKLEQGFQIQLRGVMNTRDFRGTYLAAIDGAPLQYGTFQLAVGGGGTAR